MKHLLVTTIEDASNIKAWSGIPYSLREALERQVERVTVFKPGPPARSPIDVLKRIRYGSQRYALWMTNASLRRNAKELRAEIGRLNPDGVLGILAQPLVFLDKPAVPVFFFADAAYQSFRDRYKGTLPVPIRAADYARQEADVARRIDGVCLGSEWAVRDADRVFSAEFPGIDFARKLHVTPLGSNWVPSRTREQVLESVERRATDGLELLYLGVDWLRKGGPLAVQVAKEIRDRGHKVRLHVVGCRPELPPDVMDIVTVHGPLYRSDAAQAAALTELFERSHFMVTPTTAECYGIAFAEAQAFALPPVSRAIDALPTVVQDGVTGLLLSPDAPASAYVERILALHNDRKAYVRMATAARDRYEKLLNWDKTAEGILRAMRA